MLFVKSILSTVAQLGRLGRRSEPAQPAADKPPTAPTGTSSATSPPSDSMRQILAEYDVTNISPRAFSDLLQKLRQAGSLSEKDFQELSSIRLDLEHEGADPDQRVNLVERYAKKLSSIRDQHDANAASDAARQATEASLQRQLEWLRKVAQVRSGTGPAAFDTLA